MHVGASESFEEVPVDFEAMMGSEPAASSRRSAAERAAAQASRGVEETSPYPLADTEAAVLDGLDDLAGLAGEVAGGKAGTVAAGTLLRAW